MFGCNISTQRERKKIMENRKTIGYYYKYKSRFTGQDCVAILTIESRNIKTGNMGQVYFLGEKNNPWENYQKRKTEMICGYCPLQTGGCYVTIWRAPLQIYKTYKAGRYQHITAMREKLESVRFGSYGDTASMSKDDFYFFLFSVRSDNFTGYTHDWMGASWLRPSHMASVETISAAYIAQKRGWRTFRMLPEGASRLPSEIQCLNKSSNIRCVDCIQCNGSKENDQRPSITIPPHGVRSKQVINLCD